jgi:hypothetical protein
LKLFSTLSDDIARIARSSNLGQESVAAN